MRKGTVALLVVFVAIVLAAFWLRFRCRQPENFLELRLTLAKRQWRLGEHPWYLLQIKNVGCKNVIITDPFWVDQDYLIKNYDARPSPFGPDGWLITKQRTFFELTDPKGVELHSGKGSWGFHGDRKFWGNDCGGQLCERSRYICGPDLFEPGKERCEPNDTERIEVNPGETLTATPSMVLPIQPPDKGDPFIRDGRDLPSSVPPNLPPDKLERLRQEWRKSVEDLMLMGDIRHPTDSGKALAAIPPGYRILENYLFWEPGVYRIKAVYAPEGDPLAESAWKLFSHRLDGLLRRERLFRYESNTVEFELVPSTTSRLNFDINEVMRLPPEKRQAWIEKILKTSEEREKRMDKWEKRYFKDLEKRMEKMDKFFKKVKKAEKAR